MAGFCEHGDESLGFIKKVGYTFTSCVYNQLCKKYPDNTVNELPCKYDHIKTMYITDFYLLKPYIHPPLPYWPITASPWPLAVFSKYVTGFLSYPKVVRGMSSLYMMLTSIPLLEYCFYLTEWIWELTHKCGNDIRKNKKI